MIKSFLLSAGLTSVALGIPIAVIASEFSEGLLVGRAILTCAYLEGEKFKDPEFGVYMLQEQYNELPQYNKSFLLDMWLDDEDFKCIKAVGY